MKLLTSVLLLSLIASSRAQTAPSQHEIQLPTLKAQANLVVVDVVVTDKNRNPVKGLKKDDFTLIEDKAPQKLVSFDEHTAPSADEPLKIQPPPRLPPGIFTNFATAPVNSAVDVLLIDSLNTPILDQDYVHKQVIDFLGARHPGTRVAIFGLGVRLVMLQGFTDDPASLLHAAQHLWSKTSPLIANSGGAPVTESIADTGAALGISDSSGSLAALELFQTQVSVSQLESRADLTLSDLNILARYLAAIPGRKNVIWFSSSFPINLFATINAGTFNNASIDLPSGEAMYRKTVNLLTRSQVALYPVDAVGVRASPVFLAEGGASLNQTTPLNDTSATANANEHQAMNQLAEDSGGHAFYNVNNLTQAVDDAIALGSNYYTLTYTPNNPGDKRDFHHIEVKLAEKGYHLEYRRGYFADTDHDRDTPFTVNTAAGSPPPVSPLRKAMLHGVPGPTEILFKVRALPVKGTDDKPAINNTYSPAGIKEANGKFQRYLVDFDTEAHNYTLTPTPEGKFHLNAEFAALVYQRDGKLIDIVSNTIAVDLTPAQRNLLLKSGLDFRLQVSVPTTGEHFMRIGVRDITSDRVGSLEFPVSAIATLPPVDPPAPPAPQPSPKPSM